jgi:hypothetical protein
MAWKDEIRHVVVLMLGNQSVRLPGFLRLPDPSQQLDGERDEALPSCQRSSRLYGATRDGAHRVCHRSTPGHQLEDITFQLLGRSTQ